MVHALIPTLNQTLCRKTVTGATSSCLRLITETFIQSFLEDGNGSSECCNDLIHYDGRILVSPRERALARASKRLKWVEGARLCPFAEQETDDQHSDHTGWGPTVGHPRGWTLGGDPARRARSGTTSRTSPGLPRTALDSEAAVSPATVPGPPPLAWLSQASPGFMATAGYLACWRLAGGPEQPAFLLFRAPFV